ncbi:MULTISPECIES: hypothetical protein [Oerskovia]|uniref:Uncharacterized protein n=1 Tax=Oerskovia paurometabola TaxID=162170 RepID=A0ABW1X5E3_9CELL|nr:MULTISPECIES: hypothetical protein [Oerskovia]MBM7495848.1 amino acid efflux transporter [Oerskovia paurometabola]
MTTADRKVPAYEPAVTRGITGAVLGAGMVVMPPVVSAVAGERDLLAWSVHVALGGSVSLVLCALVVRARLRPTTLAGVLGVVWGPWARRTQDLAMAVAFTAGQAAIAWFVATSLLTAADGTLPSSDGDGLVIAWGILALAVLGALSPLRIPAVMIRWRPWIAGLLALSCAAAGWPAGANGAAGSPLAPSGLAPGGALWLAIAALFFAGVGWESVTELAPRAGATRGRSMAGTALGAAAVAVVLLGLAAVQRSVVGVTSAPYGTPVPLRWALAGATGVVLTSYCLTNVRTAAGIASRVAPGACRAGDSTAPARSLVGIVGVACCGFAWLGDRDGGVPLLLLGPAAAVGFGYALAAAGAVRYGGPVLRCSGALLVLALVLLSVLAVPILHTA